MYLSARSCLPICLAAFPSGTGPSCDSSNSTGLLHSAIKQTCTVKNRCSVIPCTDALTHASWFSTFAMQKSMQTPQSCTISKHIITHQGPQGQCTHWNSTTASVDRLTRPGHICFTWSGSFMKYIGIRMALCRMSF